ncbi:hypothetical protein INS49_002240 [Diaporthe citri]|uniref:uncharacterized protein n=1 Tax=Diaporthe citri TaxID=83186 RepID=UPI001C81994E|nr:uncharacterized protein INS49_002240 [Diaporthe citri]KAG6368040.1 hypothetical protein INS49_002240 [Diaporthe citri]
MAAESSPSGAGPDSTSTGRLPMPSRNPLPLSASQEAQVREIFYERIRGYCGPEIKAFAACALGRTFSVPFACREPHRVMNACMKAHATPQEEDAAREDWFARRQRARERQEKERRKAEQQRFMREWWGLEESEREEQLRRAAEEKLTRAERVGGFASGSRRRFEGEEEPGRK